MSEANASFNPQDPSASSEGSSPAPKKRKNKLAEDTEWGDVWAEPPHVQSRSSKKSAKDQALKADQIFDASALDGLNFEDAFPSSELPPDLAELAVDESAVPDYAIPADSVSANLSSIAAWSQETLDPAELPNLSDLISLIQELNQCNGALMDRVSQLEEDLEHSQNALQAEVGRTQEHGDTYVLQDLQSINAQDWATVQEQITTLFNQLEFAHQTNQRQQILIETLTGQLENGQERVAQLEREAALLQQRYNEQTQLLAKSEGTCRDLQARLQRQQRYTLQFKAALEKCLEMPTPQYEVGLVTEMPEVPVALSTAAFLPKAQRIQPWSAHTQIAAMKSPWMKLQHLDLEAETAQPTAAQPKDPVQGSLSDGSSDGSIDASLRVSPQTHIDLPSFGLASPVDEDQLSIDSTLADPLLEEQVQRLTTDPALRQHLDAAVKPLADMLAEALLAEQTASSKFEESQLDEPRLDAEIYEEPSYEGYEGSSADELLASTMADAEDALWQDLARLIDVSAEDVVKASLSGDLAAFESINFDGMPSAPSDETTTPEPERITPDAVRAHPLTNNPLTNHDASTVAPLIRKISQTAGTSTVTEQPAPKLQAQPSHQKQAPQEVAAAPGLPSLANSSWPSPVVYPLRTTKKRQSLAMVDLPTFPKGES